MLSKYWCGSTYSEVAKTPITLPSKGAKISKQWKGVSHKVLIDTFQKHCRKLGWKPTDLRIDLSFNGSDMAFSMSIPGRTNTPTFTSAFSVFSSNSGRNSMKVFSGVYFEDIGIVSNSIQGPAYTYSLDIDSEVSNLVYWISDNVVSCENIRTTLSSYSLTNFICQDILWELCRKQLVSWSYLGRIDEELQKVIKPNLWDMLLVVNKIIGLTAAKKQCQSMLETKNFFMALVNNLQGV